MASENSPDLLEIPDISFKRTYPCYMQRLQYIQNDDTVKRLTEDEQLNEKHENYLEMKGLEDNAKFDFYLFMGALCVREAMGISTPLLEFYFDGATEEEIEEFVSNDPWVKAGVITDWRIDLSVYTFDPVQWFKGEESKDDKSEPEKSSKSYNLRNLASMFKTADNNAPTVANDRDRRFSRAKLRHEEAKLRDTKDADADDQITFF